MESQIIQRGVKQIYDNIHIDLCSIDAGVFYIPGGMTTLFTHHKTVYMHNISESRNNTSKNSLQFTANAFSGHVSIVSFELLIVLKAIKCIYSFSSGHEFSNLRVSNFSISEFKSESSWSPSWTPTKSSLTEVKSQIRFRITVSRVEWESNSKSLQSVLLKELIYKWEKIYIKHNDTLLQCQSLFNGYIPTTT